jgi:phage tail protein X
MTDYTTIQGDTWDLISYKVYGSEKYMIKLIEANPEYRETVFFSANIKLKVPDIETPIPNKLPPWKRGD